MYIHHTLTCTLYTGSPTQDPRHHFTMHMGIDSGFVGAHSPDVGGWGGYQGAGEGTGG